MKYVTSIERQAWKKGYEEGRKIKIKQDIVIEVLILRFGIIPDDLRMRIKKIRDMSQLEKLFDWAVLDPSVDAFADHAMEV